MEPGYEFSKEKKNRLDEWGLFTAATIDWH